MSNLTSFENNDTSYINLFRFITNGILLNIVGIFGIFGNLITICILSRPQMKSSINYLLIGLAKIDTLLIFTSILLFGLPGIYPYSGVLFTYYYKFYPHLTPYVYPCAMILQFASVYTTLTISLERFVAVCHPLKVRSLCTYGRAKIYVIIICILSILYNLPHFWDTTILVEIFPNATDGNTTIYCPFGSTLRRNSRYITIYIHWCYLVFLYLVPFVSLAVLNTSIYKQVRTANRERQQLSRLQKKEIGLATMLLCVVLVFFICNLLPMIINIIETLGINNDELSTMINVSNLLVTINSSVNVVIYIIFGEKFRRLFLIMFCRGRIFNIGRDSFHMGHNESFVSNSGDRQSVRLHRQSSNNPNGYSYSVRINRDISAHIKDNRLSKNETLL